MEEEEGGVDGRDASDGRDEKITTTRRDNMRMDGSDFVAISVRSSQFYARVSCLKLLRSFGEGLESGGW